MRERGESWQWRTRVLHIMANSVALSRKWNGFPKTKAPIERQNYVAWKNARDEHAFVSGYVRCKFFVLRLLAPLRADHHLLRRAWILFHRTFEILGRSGDLRVVAEAVEVHEECRD